MRGQAATEYLMVAAMVLLIIVPAIYLFWMSSQGTDDQIRDAQLHRLGNNIIDTAEKVYYQGYPSRITLKETLPSGVTKIETQKEWFVNPAYNELVFFMNFKGSSSEYVFSSAVNIELVGDPLETGDPQVAPGEKKIVVEAIEGTPPFVRITIT